MEKDFDAVSFCEECYETYCKYMEQHGTKKQTYSYTDFQFEIFTNKEDMKEYLSINSQQNEKYRDYYVEITEAFPFRQYQQAFDAMGLHLEYEGDGDVRYDSYSPAGQDFGLSFNVEPDMSNFIDSFSERIEGFDVSEETMLWVDETGHGKNGAPYELEDVLNDMKSCKEKAEDVKCEFEGLIQKHNENVKKSNKEIAETFLRKVIAFEKNLENEPLEKARYEKAGFNAVTSDVQKDFLRFENGNVLNMKNALSSWYEEIGITNEKNIESCIRNKIYELEQNDIRMQKPIKTVLKDRIPSSTEKNIIDMFDQLFTDSSTTPELYVNSKVIPAHEKQYNSSDPITWWKKAVQHAVNSGGELWQDTYSRMELLEKYNLIPKGTCAKDSESLSFQTLYSRVDKMYGNCLYEYLHIKSLLPDGKRAAAIQKDKEVEMKRKNREEDLGR